ncbi:Eci2 [Symbiodinium sp. CCMP2456]|nr:Eci2 [Symbiodinium sp. CCMP2456]
MPAEMAAKPGTKTRGEDEEVARRRLFKGTRLCKFFLAGCCSRGETCNFAHSVDDLKQFPDFSKTRLCEPFMKSGTCEQGTLACQQHCSNINVSSSGNCVNCKFAHCRDELRPSYISSAKSKRAATGAASSQVPQEPAQAWTEIEHCSNLLFDSEALQVPATAGQEGEQPVSQLQSLMPATKAGIIHSAAMYTLILQGLSGQGGQGGQGPTGQGVGSGQARCESLRLPMQCTTGQPCQPERVCPASPCEIDKGGSNWSRQSTEVVDEDGRRFSRQTTEDPSYSRQTTAFSRQTTEEPSYIVGSSRQAPEEPRRPLPLSELLSLPEPEPGEPTESSQQPSRAVSRGSSEYEARERSEELNVRLKNTFLHFETAQTSDASTKVKARPSSLPPNFLGRGPGMNGRSGS